MIHLNISCAPISACREKEIKERNGRKQKGMKGIKALKERMIGIKREIDVRYGGFKGVDVEDSVLLHCWAQYRVYLLPTIRRNIPVIIIIII
jgi:hypothetical protein